MKVLYFICICIVFVSCGGVLWEGEPRYIDSGDITIVIDCPECEYWQTGE